MLAGCVVASTGTVYEHDILDLLHVCDVCSGCLLGCLIAWLSDEEAGESIGELWL